MEIKELQQNRLLRLLPLSFQAAAPLPEEQAGPRAGGDGPPGHVAAHAAEEVCSPTLITQNPEQKSRDHRDKAVLRSVKLLTET